MMTDKQLNSRHRTHSEIKNATPARKQARYYRLLYHFTGSAWIAPDDNRARADVGAEGLGKTRQQSRRQRFADDSAHA